MKYKFAVGQAEPDSKEREQLEWRVANYIRATHVMGSVIQLAAQQTDRLADSDASRSSGRNVTIDRRAVLDRAIGWRARTAQARARGRQIVANLRRALAASARPFSGQKMTGGR